MKSSKWFALWVALSLPLGAASAAAQTRFLPPRRLPRPQVQRYRRRPTPATPGDSLKSHIGVEAAKHLLASTDADVRRQGLRRLGSIGSARAVELLVKSLEPGGVVRSSRDRLVAVRALAPYARLPDVRQALVLMMSGVGVSRKQSAGDELEQWVRESAAAALAASGDGSALAALGKALRQGGPVAEAAAAGLAAHPPRDLSPVVAARGVPTLTLVKLLSGLSDQRGFHSLRSFVRHGSPEVRAAAAVALTGLGDLETVPLARFWLEKEKLPVLRLAGARILAMTHAPGAAPAIERLLDHAATRREALALALVAPNPALLPALGKRLGHADPAELPALLGAISRAGGPRAAALLASQLEKPRRAALAAYALARCPGSAARDRIEAALRSASTRRLAARAAVIRRIVLAEDVPGDRRVLQALLASKTPADRAAGAWGLSVLDVSTAKRLLGSKDPVVVRAAARAAAWNPVVAPLAAERLVRERDPTTRVALAASLAVPAAENHVPTRVLLDLIDSGSAATPLAVRALAARDSTTLRPRIEALLESGDALVRAHAALGLGDSQRPDAVGVLSAAYRFEPSADVRRAIVVALSRLAHSRRTLELARRLDGNAAVRSAADRALRGRQLYGLAPGSAVLWLSLVSSDAARTGAVQSANVELVTATGLALPAVPDPDGLLLATGLPAGPVVLRVAAPAVRDKADTDQAP